MGNRETRTFKTSGGHEVEVYTYQTAKDAREVQGVYLSAMTVDFAKGGEPSVKDVDSGISIKAQDKTIELMVKNLDGTSDKVLSRMLELPKTEFEEIISEMDKSAGLNEEKKTK